MKKMVFQIMLKSEGAVIPLLAVGPGQSHAGGPGKFDFYCSKCQWLANYLFVFYVKFSAVWGISISIQAYEIITIRDFLVSWKTFICETLNLTRESWITSH